MKILITYGTRPLAQRLVRLLDGQHEVVLATCEEVPAVLKNFYTISHAKNPTYVHEVLKRCLDSGVEYILPLAIEEMHVLHEARVLLEEYGVSVLIPKDLEGVSFMESPPTSQPLSLFSPEGKVISGAEDSFEEDQVGLYAQHEENWYLVTL